MPKFKINRDLQLKLKLRRLNKITDINYGGCALVAYGLVRFLKRVSPRKKPQIVYIMCTYGDSESITALESGSARSCGHAMVRVGRHYYDSTGKHTKTSAKLNYNGSADNTFINVSPELVMDSITKHSWNRMFNREFGIPKINKALNLDHNVLPN